MNNLFMIISILGGLSSLTLTVVLITSLFVKRLKPRRKKFTIALITSVILCVFGGALYEISPEDKARMAQEAEAKKVAQAQEKEEKAQAKKEAEAKEKAEKEEKAKAKEQAKKEAEEKKAQEEAQKKEEETKRKAEQEEADRIKAEEKAKKETEKAEREAQKAAEEEKKKAESDAKKKAEENEAKRLKAEKEEKEQKAQAKKEKEENDKKAGTKVEIERYDTCNSQGKYCDRGGFHKGAFDSLQLGMNPEEVTLKLDRNAEEATIYYMKDKSGNYVELINYYFEGAVYNVNAYFKDGKLYYAERNDKLHKPEERLMLGELE
ncbi:cell division protein MukB [Bacillus paranthracis]|uniref:cell division protein MukB n=2 Tax=Bacillus TaxID=1386 RepID=UPI001F0949C6|nr:cell division protein MukB [Bacillus paranthracis]